MNEWHLHYTYFLDDGLIDGQGTRQWNDLCDRHEFTDSQWEEEFRSWLSTRGTLLTEGMPQGSVCGNSSE